MHLYAQIIPNGGPTTFSRDRSGVVSDTTEVDSTVSNHTNKPAIYPYSQLASKLWLGHDTLRQTDSQLLLNHRYTPENRSIQPYINLGVAGSPHQLLRHQDNRLGFGSGLTLFESGLITPHNFRFHRVGQAFTRFDYSQGAGGYIGLEALHTQNFSPTWNVSIDYRSLLNEDMYVGSTQDNLGRNLGIGSNFKTQNSRYQQQLIFTWNRNRRVENGGLRADSLFYGPIRNDINSFEQRTFGYYQPTLNDASSFTSKTHHSLNHRYYLDTSLQWSVYHKWDFHNDRRTFTDDRLDTGFYGPGYLFDSSKTNDSMAIRYQTQAIGIERSGEKWQYSLGFKTHGAGLRYQNDTVLRREVDLRSYSLQSAATLFFWKNHRFDVDYNRFFSGYLDRNQSLRLESDWRPNDSFEIQLKFDHSIGSPLLVHRYYLGNFIDLKGYINENHRITKNEFQFNLNYASSMLKFVSNLRVGDRRGELLFFNSLNPSILGDYQFIQADISTLYKSNHWLWAASLSFHRNNAQEVKNLGLPTFYPRLGISYQNDAFKKALTYRLGVDLSYTSSYAAWEYRPEMGQFILQNQTHILGNYPLLDAYLSGRIQTVDFFLKLEHINEWWLTPGTNFIYEYTRSYPIQPFRFRFGFSWKFWN